MVKCFLPVYAACTQFFMYVQSSSWYYTQHPNCIPSSFSSSKSKLISFSIFPSVLLLSTLTTIFAVSAMRMIVQWSLHFVACGFCKAVIVASVKSLGHFPVSYMLFINCIIILRQSSPNSWSTSPGTSLSSVAFLTLISLTAFPFHLQNIRAIIVCVSFLFRFDF